MNQSTEQAIKEEEAEDNDSKNIPLQSETQVSPSTTTSETNDDTTVKVEKGELKQSEDEMKEISLTVLDENSNSTQSSDSNNSSGRRKRRREGQILIEDLIGIDMSLEVGFDNHLKSTPSQLSTDANFADQNDLSGQAGDGDPKKSKEDSPAFHLRPRRSHKLAGPTYSGYGSGSDSSSPVSFFFSPIKRSKQPLMKKSINSYTQQLLSDTSKQLNQFINNQNCHSGHNESCTPTSSQNSSFDSKDDLVCSLIPKPLLRAYSRSILCNVDVSVFAEFIAPLDLVNNNVYTNNYLALQIVDIKPLRYVNLGPADNDDKLSSPLLELKALDINDRFNLEHTRGMFDNSDNR